MTNKSGSVKLITTWLNKTDEHKMLLT